MALMDFWMTGVHRAKEQRWGVRGQESEVSRHRCCTWKSLRLVKTSPATAKGARTRLLSSSFWKRREARLPTFLQIFDYR